MAQHRMTDKAGREVLALTDDQAAVFAKHGMTPVGDAAAPAADDTAQPADSARKPSRGSSRRTADPSA